MKQHVNSADLVAVLVALMVVGCAPTGQTARPDSATVGQTPQATGSATQSVQPGLSTGGQAIVGHETIPSWWPKGGKQIVEFQTARKLPRGEELWAIVPDDVLAGEVPVVGIFWHGDQVGSTKSFRNNARRLAALASGIGEDLIAVYRPHSTSKYDWRSTNEIRTQLALVEYLSNTFGIRRFNLYGHSGGALVAIAVAQERPHLAAAVGLASTKPAVGEHYRRHEGGIPNRYYRQYDPIRHIHKLQPDIPVLVVHDPRDKIVRFEGGVAPYLKRAAELNLRVRFVKVETMWPPHHDTVSQLGAALKALEHQAFLQRE